MEPAPYRARADPRGHLNRDERRNRAFWDGDADDYQAVHGAALAAAPEAWGVWRIPDAELQLIGDVMDIDVLELGCGAAAWSRALTRRGARAVGLDISVAQLGHARRASADARTVSYVCASATTAPFRDAAFDLIFCDHGAMSFCDPALTVPECARLLRDGGRLVFSTATQLYYLTWNPESGRQTRRLHESWQPRWTVDTGSGTVDVVWSHGEWIRAFAASDLVVDDLVELLAPIGASTTFDDFVPVSWAQRWPAEEIWCLTRLPRL